MKKFKPLLVVSIAVLSLLAGCGQKQQYQAVERICMPNVNKLKAMEAAEHVLAKMRFTIDKSDEKLGVIRTRPLAGAQFFELWRSDNTGAFNSAEANLHSIRRTAELNINQQGNELCIRCDVKTQRLSLPERRIDSNARAYEMFSTSTPSMQRLKLDSEQKRAMAWVDLGTDSKLATRILARLEKQITRKEKTP